MLRKLLLISLIFTTFSGFAQVWENTNKWTPKMEQKYQKWVKDAVKKDIFTNPKSHYCQIDTDCADMIYSLRAIFSYENGLPFQIKNTMGGNPQYLSNSSRVGNKADKYSDEKYLGCLDPEIRANLAPEKIKSLKRLREFLTFINDNITDTYGLAFRDTLPVDPAKVQPGDLYVSPVKTDRHSYLIKDISILGHFHLLYDTMMESIADLFLLKGLPKFTPNGYGWGMKRFVTPGYHDQVSSFQKNEKSISEKSTKAKNDALNDQMKFWGFSFDQYTYESKDYFKSFFKDLKLENEPIDLEIKRKIQNICTHLYQRIVVVNDAMKLLDLKDQPEGRKYFDDQGCFKPAQYRKLSTPSRDSTTMTEIESLYQTWKKHITTNEEKRYSSNPYDNLVPWFIFNDYIENSNWDYELIDIPKATRKLEQQILSDEDSNNPCNQLKMGDSTFKISNFIYRYRNQQQATNPKGERIWVSSLSTNPNDEFEARWGHDDHLERTQCINYDETGEMVD